jgi:galactokinase
MEMGMTPEEACSRAGLIERTTQAFTGFVGRPPVWRWFVPGRIEVFGKHTDYAGGRSLVAAVPRGFAVAARPRPDDRVRVVDVRDAARAELDLTRPARHPRGWASYVHVVARRLARNFPGAPLGADITVLSDLPPAAGLSSSSALVVSVAIALARRAALPERSEWRDNISGVEDLAWYLGCVENGLDYRRLAGTAGVGTHGGSEDHTAILACRAGQLSQYRYVPVSHVDDSPMPAGWTFVVASSGVHAAKSGSVKAQYNRASLMTRALLECWNAAIQGNTHSLGAALMEAGAVERLRTLVRQAPTGGFSSMDLDRRLAHFVAEDARVPEAARSFAAADAAALGRLSEDSQREADEWLGNQIPETRALAALARGHGAFAASSFGAGFGGSVWALVDAREADRFGRAWVAAYARLFPAHADVRWFAARPGPALVEVTSEK